MQVNEHTILPHFTIMEVACALAFDTLDDLTSKDVSLASISFNGTAIDSPSCLLLCTMDIHTCATQLSISALHGSKQEPIARMMSAHTSLLRPPHLRLYPSKNMGPSAMMRRLEPWNISLSPKRPPDVRTPITSSVALANTKDMVNGVWLQPGTAESSLQLTTMLLKEADKGMQHPCAWQATSCSAFVARYATS